MFYAVVQSSLYFDSPSSPFPPLFLTLPPVPVSFPSFLTGESYPSLPDIGILVTSGVLGVGVCWGCGGEWEGAVSSKVQVVQYTMPCAFISQYTAQ